MGWKVIVSGDKTFTEINEEKLKQDKANTQNLVGQSTSQNDKNDYNFDEKPSNEEVGVKGNFIGQSTQKDDKNNEFCEENRVGVGVNGLWLEGGKWNEQEGRLEDGVEGEVFFDMPEVVY